jgi:chaperonin cofactor prefoldin
VTNSTGDGDNRPNTADSSVPSQSQPADDQDHTDIPIRETRHPASNDAESEPEPKDRFDALVRDRDSLRAEVTDMRKSLEEIQSKHKADMEALQEKLEDTETKKEQAETQFQKLMERVNAIKSQLGQRLKEDEVSTPDTDNDSVVNLY